MECVGLLIIILHVLRSNYRGPRVGLFGIAEYWIGYDVKS